MGGQRHLIRRQIVELRIPAADRAAAIQSEVSRILRQRLMPMIERYCDELSSPGRLDRIDRLELDLGRLDAGRLEHELVEGIAGILRLELAGELRRQEEQAPARGRTAPVASRLELIERFLRLGLLPWWADLSQPGLPGESLDFLLREAPDALRRLLGEFSGDAGAHRRLVGHSDDRRLAALIGLRVPGLGEFPLALLEVLDHLPEQGPGPEAWPSSRFKARLRLGLYAAAEAQDAVPTAPGYARTVLSHLAGPLALPYPALVLALAQAAAKRPGAAEVRAIADELAGELEIEASPRRMQDTATPVRSPVDALAAWLESGEPARQAPPAWLGQWPPALIGDLEARLRRPVGQSGPELAELARWLAGFPEWPPPSWLAGWPGRLREEFTAALFAAAGMSFRPVPISPDVSADPAGAAGVRPDLAFSDSDEIHVINGGLVILWPFLPRFFERLDLMAHNRFVDEPARYRAVALLHTLATGDPAPSEYLLPLNKLLCGLDLDAVFGMEEPLSGPEIAECVMLLEAVIAQAPILGEMSTQGFRGSFLLRAGMLEVRDGAWLLRVERETHDLVLERFPWSFQWVRLPWMDAPLAVEW